MQIDKPSIVVTVKLLD